MSGAFEEMQEKREENLDSNRSAAKRRREMRRMRVTRHSGVAASDGRTSSDPSGRRHCPKVAHTGLPEPAQLTATERDACLKLASVFLVPQRREKRPARLGI